MEAETDSATCGQMLQVGENRWEGDVREQNPHGLKKPKRQEIKGPVQLKCVDELIELSKGFGTSTSERTDFWIAAEDIIGDLGRKRAKKMMERREQIATRVEPRRQASEESWGEAIQHRTIIG